MNYTMLITTTYKNKNYMRKIKNKISRTSTKLSQVLLILRELELCYCLNDQFSIYETRILKLEIDRISNLIYTEAESNL